LFKVTVDEIEGHAGTTIVNVFACIAQIGVTV
jgi:hypothetical protein